jgi:hypothetical protein
VPAVVAAPPPIEEDVDFIADPSDVRYVTNDIKGGRSYAKWMAGKCRDNVFFTMYLREEKLLPSIWADGAPRCRSVGETYMEERISKAYPWIAKAMWAEAKIPKEKISKLFYWLGDCNEETILPDDDYVKSEAIFEENMETRMGTKLRSDAWPATPEDLKLLCDFETLYGNIMLGPSPAYGLAANQFMLTTPVPVPMGPAGVIKGTLPVAVADLKDDVTLTNNHLPNVTIASKRGGFVYQPVSLLKLLQGGDVAVARLPEQPLVTFQANGEIPENMKYRFPTADQIREKRKRVVEARAKAKAAAAPVQAPEQAALGRKQRRTKNNR